MRPVPTGTGALSLSTATTACAPEVRHRWWLGAGLLTAAIGLTGCGVTRADSTPAHVAGPVRLEPVPGTDREVVILTQAAASRLGIRSEPVLAAPAAHESVIPVAALLYDRNGATWTYTIRQPLTYVRVAVTVVRVDGERALLRSGPAVGTPVVTIGGAELLGAEYGVAGE